MAIGPGKFDWLCTEVREKTKARGAIVVVMEGEGGSGFSVQAPIEVQLKLPELLRTLAAHIESDLKKLSK